MFFTPESYPELSQLSRKERRAQVNEWYQHDKRSKFIHIFSFVVPITASFPWLKPLSLWLIGSESFFLAAFLGGVTSLIVGSIVLPIISTFVLRKRFLQYWSKRSTNH